MVEKKADDVEIPKNVIKLQRWSWQRWQGARTKQRGASLDGKMQKERPLQEAYGMQNEAQGVGWQRRRQRRRKGLCGGDEEMRGRRHVSQAARPAASGDEERRW